jgi:hypothetical protein
MKKNEPMIASAKPISNRKPMSSRCSPGAAAKLMAAFCLLSLSSASAAPQLYQLVGVTFNDGGTATGSFVFDPNAGTPCSTATSPCGIYSNVNITTTTGTARTGAVYHYVCGQDVPTCTGVTPDSTMALDLTTTAGNQTGLPGLAFFFTGVGAVPPAGLGNGSSIDISNSSLAVGAVQEGTCVDAVCSAPAPPTRVTVAGSVVLVTMEISYAANLNVGESYINITNTGANGAPLNGPGFGASAGNICVNVYAFDPSEELVACCSCLITPDQTVNLGVVSNLTSKTLTGVVPTSVTVKLAASLAGVGGSGSGTTACNNSAASVAVGNLVIGMTAFRTTLHATPTAGSYATTETPFTNQSINPADLASVAGRCASIIGNASGFGICSSCRTGALGGTKL